MAGGMAGGRPRTGIGAIDGVAELADSVDGWLSRREGELLYELARKCRRSDGVIVEVGSWKGKSTIWLGSGSMAGERVPVYAVDPHMGFPDVPESYGHINTFDEFKANIERAGVHDVIVPMVMTSEEAAADFTEPVALLFVDGVHLYDYVKTDFESWFPKVCDGGILVFHDTVGSAHTGAKRFAERHIYRSRRFRGARFVDSATVVEKVDRNRWSDVAHLYWTLLLKKVIEPLPLARVPKPVRAVGRRLLNRLQSIGG